MNSEKQTKEKVFKYKCTFSGTINDTMNRRGWVQVDEDSDDWDIFWCDMNQLRDLFTTRCLDDWQRVGHFRNCHEISRKNLMVKNLRKLRHKIERGMGKEQAEKLDFFPTTFILPTEHKQFIHEFRRTPGAFWIIKPAAGAQGRGIYIFERLKEYFDWRAKFDSPENSIILRAQQQQLHDQHIRQRDEYLAANPQGTFDPKLLLDSLTETAQNPAQANDPTVTESQSDISQDSDRTDSGSSDATNVRVKESSDTTPVAVTIGTHRILIEPNKNDMYVVQRYIATPYLIGGRKFDIRLYVLLTSFSPMKAWMYREGFARFSRGQFSLKSLRDVYVHLTNVAIQRTSEDYDAENGSKWSLNCLREYMTARHGTEAVQRLMNEIDTIVIRTLQSVQHQMIQDKHSFELYGFDVIIDSKIKPWLLEVNASPAFSPSNEEDYRLKCALLDDTVSILDLEERLTGEEKRVGGYDLFWNEGPVYANPGDCGHVSGDSNGSKMNTFLGCKNDRVNQLRNTYGGAKFIKDVQRIQGSSGGSNSVDIPLQAFAKSSPKVKDNRYKVPD